MRVVIFGDFYAICWVKFEFLNMNHKYIFRISKDHVTKQILICLDNLFMKMSYIIHCVDLCRLLEKNIVKFLNMDKKIRSPNI